MNAAIAQHLNVTESAIIEVQEWARVLWVRVKGLGARFVSKKVAKMEGTEKQIKWAESIKADFLRKLKNGQRGPLALSESDYNAVVEAANNRRTSAAWWIDRRFDGNTRMAEAVVGRVLSNNSVIW